MQERQTHLVTGLLLFVSFGVAMADDVLKLRRIVPARQKQESIASTQTHRIINAKSHLV